MWIAVLLNKLTNYLFNAFAWILFMMDQPHMHKEQCDAVNTLFSVKEWYN